MTELELLLRETAAEVEFPATPDVVRAVRDRIRSGRPDTWTRAAAPRRRLRLRRPLAVALAALLVVSGGAAAIPGVRDPVLDFLGLRSVRVERVPRLPLKPSPGDKLALGRRTTLAAARKRLGFHPVLPDALSAPAVYVDRLVPGGALGLVYRDGHVLLTEVEGSLRHEFLQKFVTPQTRVDRVTVEGERGLWISGRVHEVVYLDARGEIRPDSIRIAGPTLLWRHGSLLLRLEGVRSEAEALRIASSVRAAP